ncbi:MAG: hypothetical protein AB7N76_26045 [Planctomycetota bacterium]
MTDAARRCPFCADAIGADIALVACPRCGAGHHPSCEAGGARGPCGLCPTDLPPAHEPRPDERPYGYLTSDGTQGVVDASHWEPAEGLVRQLGRGELVALQLGALPAQGVLYRYTVNSVRARNRDLKLKALDWADAKRRLKELYGDDLRGSNVPQWWGPDGRPARDPGLSPPQVIALAVVLTILLALAIAAVGLGIDRLEGNRSGPRIRAAR